MKFDTSASSSGRAQKQSKYFFCIKSSLYSRLLFHKEQMVVRLDIKKTQSSNLCLSQEKNSLWKSNISRLESPTLEVKQPSFIPIDSSSLLLTEADITYLTRYDKDYIRLGTRKFLAHARYSRHSKVSSNFPVLNSNKLKINTQTKQQKPTWI